MRESTTSFALDDDVVHDEATFRVRARFVDHDIPCLAYAVEEKARVKVAKDRLDAFGVATGAWLRISSTRCCPARRMRRPSTCDGAIATAIMR